MFYLCNNLFIDVNFTGIKIRKKKTRAHVYKHYHFLKMIKRHVPHKYIFETLIQNFSVMFSIFK